MEHFAKRKTEYLLLRSEQLVGAALIIVVKQGLTSSLRSIEAATKKVRSISSYSISQLIVADRSLWSQRQQGRRGYTDDPL